MRQRAVHLEKRLPQEAVNALEKTSAPAVAREGKIERVDFRLRPVGFTGGGPFQKPGAGCAVSRNFLVQNTVLVAYSGRVGFVLGCAARAAADSSWFNLICHDFCFVFWGWV
jgi:hypothetical protein